MNEYQFVAAMVASLAWPIVALVGIVVFRGEIVDLVKRVEHFKAGPIEAWMKAAEELHAVVAKVSSSIPNGREPGPLRSKYQSAVAVLPAGVVVMAWADIEAALDSRLVRAGIPQKHVSAAQMVDEALSHRLVDANLADAIRGLAKLRNMVAHNRLEQISNADATDYLEMGDTVLRALEQGNR